MTVMKDFYRDEVIITCTYDSGVKSKGRFDGTDLLCSWAMDRTKIIWLRICTESSATRHFVNPRRSK